MNTKLDTLDLIAPKVLEAYGTGRNRLNFNDVYNNTHITIQANYTDMAKKHTLRARYASSRHVYDSETLTVGTPGPLNFKVPRLEVIDSIGGIVAVNYSIRLTPDAPLLISKTLSLHVDAQLFDLSEPRLSADRKTATVKFLNMTPGYTVRVRWHGVIVRDTEIRPIQNSSSIPFDIPTNWVTENAEKTVLVNYSVHQSGSDDNLMFSRLLRVTL